MRVLVCGGRDFEKGGIVFRVLNELDPKPTVIIHGGARGADSLAGLWAHSHDVPVEVYNAEWDKYGKSAGRRRNLNMLVQAKPELVVAFPGGAGTGHMMKTARDAGITVIECRELAPAGDSKIAQQ